MPQLFTSECVCVGHPDKVCDQISDGILDALLAVDPNSRVACETAVKTGLVVILGEITSKAVIDYAAVARDVIKSIGYSDPETGFDWKSCGILTALERQSPDIAMGVDEGKNKKLGAGDQGMMYGYACNDTPTLMPAPIYYARKITEQLRICRESNELSYLRPDGKTQVTVEYENGKPVGITAVVCSTQHTETVSLEQLRSDVMEKIIRRALPADMLSNTTKFYINPTGRFVIGGPKGDSGLTGRKIIVDTYGGIGRHGGGAFSGKDSTKVDRSAAYAARHAAKNIVAAGLADRCEINLAYAIGIAEPVAINIDTFGTGKIADEKISQIVSKAFDFTPGGIIEYFKLRRPIFRQTAREGHFGIEQPNYTWERTEKVAELKKLAGLKEAVARR
jgi:S-adenosylmethionine synthetase